MTEPNTSNKPTTGSELDKPTTASEEMLKVTGATRLAGVIGTPVRHSKSPQIHNAAFRAVGFDAQYLAFEVAPEQIADALAAMRTLSILGYSVTMPHKETIVAELDDLTPIAEKLGAVNCVYTRETSNGVELVGDNTDGAGFVRAVEDEFDLACHGLKVVIFGAGGAARSVVAALIEKGVASVVVVNRDAARCKKILELGQQVRRVQHGTEQQIEALTDAELVINATPVGMAGTDLAELMPCEIVDIAPEAIVADLVYHPLETPWLKAARERGNRTQNGLAMLVFQAAIQFEHWTAKAAPVDVMKAAIQDSFSSQSR